jgi:DNA-directed RNA polymerase specialized sigma24 family protein
VVWRRRPAPADASATPVPREELHVLFAQDPARAWLVFLDRHTPELLALIERAGIVDRDEAMDIYVRICERLAENQCAALRRRDPDKGSLSGWLAVVVRRTLVDWVRSRAGRRRLFSVIRDLSELHQRLFALYYWDGRAPSEAAEILSVETKSEVSLSVVLEGLETIDGVLTARHRADLLSMTARSRATSLDADEMIGEQAADTLDPEASLRVREMDAQLTQALARLPPEDAAIISLKYGEGLTRPQIQHLLRLPELTEYRVRSILAALRRALAIEPVTAPASTATAAVGASPGHLSRPTS